MRVLTPVSDNRRSKALLQMDDAGVDRDLWRNPLTIAKRWRHSDCCHAESLLMED
jgi:hypothetical protein